MGKGSRRKKETSNVTTKKYRQEPLFSGNRVLLLSVSALLLFMFVLWLVPEAQPPIPKQEQQPKPQRPERPPKKPKFSLTEEISPDQANKEIEAVVEDRDGAPSMLVIVMDYNAEGKEAGKTWTRWERIAKNMRTKPLFARYEEDELPVVRRIDCRKGFALCQQAVGKAAGKPAFYKPSRPGKLFSADVRTDKHYLERMFEELQPALNYIEEKNDIVDFIEDNDIVLFLFGEDKDGQLEEIADGARDFGKWGRNRRPDIAEFFEVENTPKLVLFRDFEPSPVTFEGDLTSKEEVVAFVEKTNVPAFGEYTLKRSKRYSYFINRGSVSMFFLYVDALDEMFKDIEKTVLDDLLPFCQAQKMKCMFTYIDAMTGEAIARNMGISDYPRVFGNLITPDGAKRLDESIDPENVSKSLSEKFKTFVEEDDDPADDEGYYYEEYDDEDMDEGAGGGGAATHSQDQGSDGEEYEYQDYETDETEQQDKQELRRRLQQIYHGLPQF